MNEITLSGHEFRSLILCANRYAATRPFHNMSDICELIKRYAAHPMMPLEQMIREAKENEEWREALEAIQPANEEAVSTNLVAIGRKLVLNW